MPQQRPGHHYVRAHYRKNPGPPQPRWIAVDRTSRKVLRDALYDGEFSEKPRHPGDYRPLWSPGYSNAKLYLLRDLRKIFGIEVGQERNAPVIFLRVL